MILTNLKDWKAGSQGSPSVKKKGVQESWSSQRQNYGHKSMLNYFEGRIGSVARALPD